MNILEERVDSPRPEKRWWFALKFIDFSAGGMYIYIHLDCWFDYWSVDSNVLKRKLKNDKSKMKTVYFTTVRSTDLLSDFYTSFNYMLIITGLMNKLLQIAILRTNS